MAAHSWKPMVPVNKMKTWGKCQALEQWVIKSFVCLWEDFDEFTASLKVYIPNLTYLSIFYGSKIFHFCLKNLPFLHGHVYRKYGSLKIM